MNGETTERVYDFFDLVDIDEKLYIKISNYLSRVGERQMELIKLRDDEKEYPINASSYGIEACTIHVFEWDTDSMSNPSPHKPRENIVKSTIGFTYKREKKSRCITKYFSLDYEVLLKELQK